MATVIKSLSSLFCFLSILALLFSTSQIISQPEHMRTFCSQISDNFTRTSSYRTNRETLLSSLRDRSSLGTYSNVTTGLSPNTVRGMFLCRGDITRESCSDCVQTATLEISRNCTYQKEAFIFYEECMVRYSDTSFFTLVEDRPYIIRYSLSSAPNTDRFGQTLSDKMDELIIRASSSSSSSSSTPYFVEDQERVTQFEGSYDLDSIVQCSPDLDSGNCTVCLKLAIQEIMDCCSRSRWAQIFTPKCLLRYEASALASPPPPSPPPSPPSLVPSPPLFTRPQNIPSFSGSTSTTVIRGKEIFGRIFIAVMTAYVLALLGV
ncbi:PREDICTED: cysteine-rich repeat secretory protein 4-like [Camelina sativa]|uniref:Cysteine-rich repeat secretory protein 4-like n=1 Tax=Camelina sativa TaxID=90675 RepID=A0ABM0TS79_CAMSA|nr:PREDICTED: cysteine-rich repeat secretory protein 4-like [Camelina sativa]